MERKKQLFDTNTIVGLGLLTAIIIVLQTVAKAIPVGVFSITLVLVPIIVGAALYGVKAGAWLGFVFGVVVLITDAHAFLQINIPGTVVTCIAKGMLAGVAAAAVYKLLSPKSNLVAVIMAGLVSPIVNTAVFLLGCILFFLDTIAGWGLEAGFGNVYTYLITAFVGVNFLIEAAINLVLSTTIVTIIKIATKKIQN